VVRACMKAGLVGGEGFAIDASVIETEASRNHRIDGKLTAAPADAAATRPVREYLEALDKSAAAETAKSADDAPRGNPPAEPKYTSLTDPAAAWTNKGQMKALFAHLKRNLNFRRLRLRGLSGAKDEFLLAAAAQNLRKLVRFLGQGPPTGLLRAA
jgi:Transposase DDE domain